MTNGLPKDKGDSHRLQSDPGGTPGAASSNEAQEDGGTGRQDGELVLDSV